jgi:MarR family transcriptional regulator, organic hydroperoxide resistance regulator
MKKQQASSPDESLVKMAQEMDQHLKVIRQRLREPLETEFARGNLTGPQRMVMHALVLSQGLSLKQLSAQVSLAHSTVSGIVDRLQARGMVVRSRDESDGRASVIAPSSEVRDFLANRMPELAITPLAEALRAASDTERVTILRGLRKLRALVERSRAAG